jgi:Glycosyltransferase
LVNNVKTLIDAVSLLQSHKDIRLIIIGNGEQKESLVQYCKDNDINNVIFKQDWIPFTHVPDTLSHADLNILNYEKGFGDLGISSGKLFQSLASGKPLICNIDIKYDDVITDNYLGIAGGLDTPQKYADAILKVYNLPSDEYYAMCGRVKEVSKRFDYKVLSDQLINIIESI